MLSSDNGRPSIRPSVCYAAHCTHAMFLQKNSHFISATLHIHLFFLPLLSCFTLLFYVSRRLLYLIFACRSAFINLILHVKTSFSWQICMSTQPFYLQCCALTCFISLEAIPILSTTFQVQIDTHGMLHYQKLTVFVWRQCPNQSMTESSAVVSTSVCYAAIALSSQVLCQI